jgi:hypothetical protein
MAANPVSICSNACLMLGAHPINAMTDDNDRARLAANLYEPVRNRVLRAHPWNCAVKRVILAPEVTPPAFDFKAQFLLPSDWLKTLQIGQQGRALDYLTEGRKILCNVDALPLRYIFRNEVEDTWDSMLVDAMQLAMAVAFAYPLTESVSMRQEMRDSFERQMKEARAVDGQDDPPDTFGDFPLLQARFTGI